MSLEINKIYNTDCIAGIKQLEDNSIDSIVTDPPYELGFMGKSWDNSGIAYNVEMWSEAMRVLKPGGFLLAFGGTRTYHRMACAIEDAGFEIRDQMQWIYGSGFPKSLNIGKAVDKLQGNEREDIGIDPNARDGGGNIQIIKKNKNQRLTKGTSEFEGWGTALKPANEPICVARKPLAEKTVAKNVLKYGTGGINIDECRIGGEKGRFPANIILDEEAGKMLDEQSGISSSKKSELSFKGTIWKSSDSIEKTIRGHNDKGGASRFFYCAKASKKERNQGLEGFEDKLGGSYEFRQDGSLDGKIPIKKNFHPTVKPVKLMEYLVRLVTPKGGVVLDPFMGSGTTGMAAKGQGFNYIGFDMTPEYCKIADARIKSVIVQNKLVERE